MNATVQRCVFVVAIGVWLTLSFAAPWVLGDKNEFLKEYIGNDFLSFMGIIVTITLASTASIHLEFNRMEDEAKSEFLGSSRIAVRRSAFVLIALLGFGVVLSVAKPHLPTTDVSTSLINGLALLVILFSIFILTDITKLVFRIEPLFKIRQNDDN